MVFQGSQVLSESISGKGGIVVQVAFLLAEQPGLNGCESWHSCFAQCDCKTACAIHVSVKMTAHQRLCQYQSLSMIQMVSPRVSTTHATAFVFFM